MLARSWTSAPRPRRHFTVAWSQGQCPASRSAEPFRAPGSPGRETLRVSDTHFLSRPVPTFTFTIFNRCVPFQGRRESRGRAHRPEKSTYSVVSWHCSAPTAAWLVATCNARVLSRTGQVLEHCLSIHASSLHHRCSLARGPQPLGHGDMLPSPGRRASVLGDTNILISRGLTTKNLVTRQALRQRFS
jgi:hypothetical protein